MYFVMHSTVTNRKYCRLLGIIINQKTNNYENIKQQSINKCKN